MLKSVDKKTININFRFKEKNRSSQDYKAVMLAWLKGLTVFRETLQQLNSKDFISSDLFSKIVNKFDLSALEDNLEELRLIETSITHSEPTVDSIPVDSLTLVAPRSLSKDELKEKIVDLAKIQYQPDFDFDLLVAATHALLNHSDITGDEKSRYEIYFQELKEYREYLKLERSTSTQPQLQTQVLPVSRTQFQPQTQYQPLTQAQPQPQSSLEKELMDQIPSPLPLSNSNSQPSSQEYPENRSTSISQVRNEMFQQLKKLRSSFQAGQT